MPQVPDGDAAGLIAEAKSKLIRALSQLENASP
jgi:hypothetical protein